MKRMKNIRLGTLVACMCVLWGCEKPNVNIVMPQEASNRVLFAGEHCRILPVWIKMRYASVWNRLLIQPD